MNIFLENTTYLTVQELQDTFDFFENEESDNIKIWIRKAEMVIDSIIGEYGEKLIDTQKTIFPTIIDGVPLEIKQATALIGKCIFENKDKKDFGTIKSEKRRGNQVVFDTNKSDKYKEIHSCMTEEIYNLISKYISSENKVASSSFFRT